MIHTRSLPTFTPAQEEEAYLPAPFPMPISSPMPIAPPYQPSPMYEHFLPCPIPHPFRNTPFSPGGPSPCPSVDFPGGLPRPRLPCITGHYLIHLLFYTPEGGRRRCCLCSHLALPMPPLYYQAGGSCCHLHVRSPPLLPVFPTLPGVDSVPCLLVCLPALCHTPPSWYLPYLVDDVASLPFTCILPSACFTLQCWDAPYHPILLFLAFGIPACQAVSLSLPLHFPWMTIGHLPFI